MNLITTSLLFVLTVFCSLVSGQDFDHPSQRFGSQEFTGHRVEDFSPPDHFGGPQEGEKASLFQLKTLEGKSVNLADYIGKKPVVLILGSYTCPIFRGKHSFMENFYVRYGDKVEFFLIYTLEAHPKNDPSPYSGREWVTEPNEAQGILYRQPTDFAQRQALAQTTCHNLQITVPVLIDDMDNSVWNAYGSAPNAAYLIGADGTIKLRQGWFKPDEFEGVLKKELETIP